MAKRKRDFDQPRRPQRLNGQQVSKPAELDVVIPVYGQPKMFQQCLIGLEMACIDIDYRLFIVDDASPNPSEMAVIYNALPNGAKLERFNTNRGFPYTSNHGAGLGSSRSILFLNSDVILKAGSVRSMLDMLWTPTPPIEPKLDPDPNAPVGVVGPKLTFPEDSVEPTRPAGKIQHAGMCFKINGEPHHSYIGWSVDRKRANEPRSVQCVTGACLMTRREVWDKVTQNYRGMGDTATNGAFNIVYGRGTFEDMEYCIATRSLGYKIAYQPLAVGSHLVGTSIAGEKEGYPLRRNANIFKARCGHMIVWDHYRHC